MKSSIEKTFHNEREQAKNKEVYEFIATRLDDFTSNFNWNGNKKFAADPHAIDFDYTKTLIRSFMIEVGFENNDHRITKIEKVIDEIRKQFLFPPGEKDESKTSIPDFESAKTRIREILE